MQTNNNNKGGLLQEGFNKKKTINAFQPTRNPCMSAIQNYGKIQCLGKNPWPQIGDVNAWMISAETATFMKWGGLGMVASELPENFNNTFGKNNHRISIITPMYLGNTGKKNTTFDGKIYAGSENCAIEVQQTATIKVSFLNRRKTFSRHNVTIYKGCLNNVDYYFFHNEKFFSITPHNDNPSTQDGCYVLNSGGINEVERFAFFSKSVYTLMKETAAGNIKNIATPNILIANDWHSGALAGLCKYGATASLFNGTIAPRTAEIVRGIPIIHIVHHLGYQGWDYPNTAKILNSLYEDNTANIFKNAKAIKNSNTRSINTLIVYDCYNQASSNLHLADRVVTVSKNYMEEVSKELGFGFDFRNILKIRKNHRTFFGIVNGYDKKLISPNPKKIDHINEYFKNTKFRVYDENTLDKKLHNKKECIRLLSQIAIDENYKQSVIPLIDIYKFEDISNLAAKAEKIPFICATSRLVEQKGYDIAAKAIVKLIEEKSKAKRELPIFVLGGAGDTTQYKMLQNLKNEIEEINPKAAKRIFVFRGYRDEFAYTLQLAADFYLMPSRFEPCGLTQMEAMAKGSLPIAMSTGGLVDTIADCVDGFRTDVYFAGNERVYGTNLKAQKLKNNINAYADTLHKALKCFYFTPNVLKIMTINAMKKDFSWNVPNGSVYKYYKLFKTGSL